MGTIEIKADGVVWKCNFDRKDYKCWGKRVQEVIEAIYEFNEEKDTIDRATSK